MKKINKVLVLVPSASSHGGISHYFEVLRPQYAKNIKYFKRGVRNQASILSRTLFPIYHVYDIFHFISILIFKRVVLIQINTSFGATGILRDAMFILISRFFKIPFFVFFRGIDNEVIKKIEQKYWRIFRHTFLRANTILVLSEEIRNQIISWNYHGTIKLETTIVDSKLLCDFNIHKQISKYEESTIKILFLSRIEKTKGIYEAIEAFRLIHKKYPDVKLIICGEGSEKTNVLKNIKPELDHSIFYYGHIEGVEKVRAFQEAHIYIFPSYKEGMPNSLLEALAFGVPVVTSAVGGIPDIFIDGNMGYISTQIDKRNLATLIERLIIDPKKMKKISEFNYYYAKKRFYSEKVVSRLESYYKEYYQ